MKFLTILLLATATFANAADDELSNRDIFLGIIKCAQKAVSTGDPDIKVPSHEPLLISRNFSTSQNIGLQTYTLEIQNMFMDGISKFEVKKLEDVTDVGSPVFDYDIYWPLIRFTSTMKFSIKDRLTKLTILRQAGEFGFEFNHIDFYGQFQFTKPAEGVKPGFNYVDLHFKTEDAKLNADGMGILSNIIELVGGSALRRFINLDILSGGSIVRDKMNKDWVGNPERIQKLIDNCKK